MEMNIRRLLPTDYYKGFLNVIAVFSQDIIDMDFVQFEEQYERVLQQSGDTFVMEVDGKIVATAKALYEHKFHHPLMGHIEDVAVLPEYRKHGYGVLVVEHAIKSCWERGCYKVALCCREDLEPFYSKNGLVKRGISMNAYKSTTT